MNFLHIFNSNLCKNHLVWKRNVLCCSKCGKPAALRYMMDGDLRLYVYPEFTDMTPEIMLMPDTKQVVHVEDCLGIISLEEWDDFIAGIKYDIEHDFAEAINDLASIAYDDFDEEDEECMD